ncbi:ankyrin repeat domain-containing protein [Legionella sp. km772]|uniref:ankyrin repeat domain-containing protein n=1 Tax=Legionella sp. km772 TaxID=2498111 RepID=UPI000F8DE4F3|nr:ankyrin repeat domain-containing protein [Legionella sp. km772]RUR11376.1 hypothetical protein ELY15_07115 [Legionella sp. km772]
MAAEKGHFETLQYLLEKMGLSTGDKLQAIKAWGYYAIKGAASSGHLPTLRYLLEKMGLSTKDKLKVIKGDDYYAIRIVAYNGHSETLQYLLEKMGLSTEDKLEAIKARDYYAIRGAAEKGHLETLQYLLEKMGLSTEDKLEAIKEDDYVAIRWTAQHGHLATLHYLLEEAGLSTEDKLEAIKARDYDTIRSAAWREHRPIITYFLTFDAGFAYLESHDHEYGQKHVYAFVAEQLEALKRRKEVFEQPHPAGVFDVEAEEARRCFYLLRNLIRRGVRRDYADAEPNVDELGFLLTIPAVKNLAHQELNERGSNELLRLACHLGNRDAATILLTLPAVRALAEQTNYYRNEARGQLDLRALAHDRESSMHALTQGEQKRLEQATKHYEPLIKGDNVAMVMNDLRDYLRAHYQQNPPCLVSEEGRPIELPLDFSQFRALALSPKQQEEALKEYYKHPYHSAWRYLSKPNYWMHQQASYVYVDEQDRSLKWSSFAEYQFLIALCWLAAKDNAIPPTDGHTLEGRIEHFIRELMLIGRAHNWDKTREHKGIREEYDDLEGDKPSCYSGVKRRLFQSVIGHPLLKLLTDDDIRQEVRDFALTLFKTKMATLNNKEAMNEAYKEYISTLDPDSAKPLACLNFSAEEQAQCVAQLTQKYGDSFTSSHSFKMQVHSLLALDPNAPNTSDHYHALKLDGLTNLSFYLGQTQGNPHGLFGAQTRKRAEPEQVDNYLNNCRIC